MSKFSTLLVPMKSSPRNPAYKEVGDAHVIEWVRNQSAQAMITASVCTGAFILAKAGLLEGRTATTHWEDIADLQAQFGNVLVREGVRWVDDGTIVTSAGIAANRSSIQ
ncbi:MAG TPA: DJ-1/PfpI family protein [Lysobacter sp.]|jgi:transcriptional regulator GlxA family with amidase domain|nr:DJ-1/PfpI family protein [Lysobacter sp.]